MTIDAPVRPTEPIRIEHRELLPDIEALQQAAEAIEHTPEADTRRLVRAARDFLADHLIPHATAEDAVLYPAVEKAMQAPGATATMSRDHVQAVRDIEALGQELQDAEPIDEVRRRRLQRLLYGLYAVVSLHFAKEEELYLETLDRSLTPAEFRALYEEMEVAAAAAR